jgi:hypothetical protein
MLQFTDAELQAVVTDIIKKELEEGISKTVEERKTFLWDLIVGNMMDENLVDKLRNKLVQMVLDRK